MNAFNFNVLRWSIPDSLRNLCPVGIKILKFEERDLICVWFESSILIYDSVELNKFQSENNSPEYSYLLSVEGTIVDIIQLGEVVGVFNRTGLYILRSKDNSAVKSRSSPVKGMGLTQQLESLDLKLHMRMHQVLALGALNSGFVLVKKKLGKLYVDVYKAGLRMVPVEKKFSVQLPQLIHNDVSCILTSVLFEELDPVLGSLLIEDTAFIKSQIIFVGLGCGQVYCIPVVMESTVLPTPKILYSTFRPIKEIVCLKDEETQLYSHVGIFLEGSPMVHITSFRQKLHYHMVYLPASVETCCLIKDGIIVADGIDLWYSKLCLNNEKKITLENKMIGVKGVCAVCPVPNFEFILAITHYLTLYCICPGKITSDGRNKKIVVPPNAMININNQMQYLAKLKEQISLEEKVMEAISISMRDNLLQDTFTIQVQVHRMRENIWTYVFEIMLMNTIDQDYSSEMWTLHIYLKAGTLEVAETSKLEQRIRKGISVKASIVADIPESVFTVDISCSLVAKFSEDSERDNMLWAVIPIASLSLDVSYFFFPSPSANKSSIAENLLKIAQNYMGKDESVEWKEEVTESREYTYLCRLLNEKATANDMWTAVVKNSRHNFTDLQEGREMDIFVSSHHIKMSLNEDCSAMLIKCSDLKVLHHVKSSLLHLLKEINLQNFVYINRDLLTKAQELKENLQLEGQDLQALKQDWRDTVTKHLPLI